MNVPWLAIAAGVLAYLITSSVTTAVIVLVALLIATRLFGAALLAGILALIGLSDRR